MTDESKIVAQLARLARLKLTPAEEAEFTRQIPRILAYVDQLKNVETENGPIDGEENATLRPDQVESYITPDKIINQAPQRNDRFWQVPPVK